jgi:hypothetical protein
MNIFKNITKGSFAKGSGMLIILAAAQGVYLSNLRTFEILTNIHLSCFGILASLGGVMFFLGPMIYGSASVASAEQLSKKKERMLFLYLRPFELDARNILQLMLGASAGILVYLGLMKGLWWPLSFIPLIINISKEQSFQDALAPVGEFIAFGKPRERLQPVGASRIYVDGDWKREIASYMAQAKLVIVRPGGGPSIRWEVEQVLDTVPPERILFYLRFRGWRKRKEQASEAFLSYLQSRLNKELPEQPGNAPYLMFDTSWNGYFVGEANHPAELLRQLFSSSGDFTRSKLQPVFKALDVDLPPQPKTLLSSVMAAFLWLLVLLDVGLVFVAVVLGMAVLALFFFNLL